MTTSLYTVLDAVTEGMRVQVELQPRANYSLALAGIPLVRTIRVQSQGGRTLRNAHVDLALAPVGLPAASASLQVEGEILPGAAVFLEGAGLSPLIEPLANARELTHAQLTVHVTTTDGAETSITAGVDIEPYNEFRNVPELYGSLAPFVQPNANALTAILRAASQLLARKTNDSSLQGYQAGPPRAHQIAGAIYEAIRAYGLSYINPPASFENTGQKIRNTQQVLDIRMGTCVDLASMYAAALEAAGLFPVIFLTRTHAFAGFYADETYGESAVITDPNVISNIVGASLIRPVELTLIGQRGSAGSFKDAMKAGNQMFHQELDQLRGMVDIVKARLDGIRPMPLTGELDPVAVADERSFVVRSSLSNISAPATVDTPRELRVREDRSPARFKAWKRDLLDLSLRNPLLNLPRTRRVIDMLIPDGMLDLVDDAMHKGASIRLFAADELSDVVRARGVQFASELAGDQIVQDFKISRGLYTIADGERVRSALRTMRREAELLTQETGSNYLYLALGALVHPKPGGGEARAPLFLLPVRLKGGTAGRPYTIQIEGDEPAAPNLCLLQWLAVTKDLEIPELSHPPVDDAGIAVGEVFSTVRARLLEAKLPYRIDESATLAILKFSTFQIWRDLDANWEHFMANPVVAHLVHRPGEDFEDPVPGQNVLVDEKELRLPIPADGSQLRAIAKAQAGQSFVLEGPPGTGKSQTIANLIAHALAHGKKVLFVAEKQAALDVVTRRLDEVGIGPYCLNIHGAKQSMASIRSQLRAALEAAVDPEPAAWRATDARLSAALTQLASYPATVHTPNAAGLSLWEAYDALAALGDGPSVRVPPRLLHEVASEDVGSSPDDSLPESAQQSALAAALASAEPLQDAAIQLGLRPSHPWLIVGTADRAAIDPGALAAAVADLQRVHDGLTYLSDAGRNALGSILPGNELSSFLTLAAARGTDAMPQPGDGVYASRPEWENSVAALSGQLANYRTRFAQILTSVRPEAMTHPELPAWRTRAAKADGSWWLRGKRRRELVADITPHVTAPVEAEALTAFLSEWDLALTAGTELARSAASIAGLRVPSSWTPWGPAAAEDLALAAHRCRLGAWAEGREGLLQAAAYLAPGDETVLRDIDQSWRRWLCAVGGTDRSLRWWVPDGDWLAAWTRDQFEWERAIDRTGALAPQRMTDIVALTDPLDAAGFDQAVDEIMAGTVSPEQIRLALERGIASASLEERLATFDLDLFDPERHTREVNAYLAASTTTRAEARARLPHAIQSLRPFDPGHLRGGVADLKRQLDRKRGGMTFRELAQRFPGPLTSLTPCFLMSPGSVAHFLDAASITFDLVIFDEASQIRVPQAIGAMGRAKAVIVVGDSKQMPPTRVMEVSANRDDAPDEQIVVGDLESILSEAVESGLPREWLAWHYRSRSESLIAFSNERYYDSRLVTIPQPELSPPSAVSWRRIDGRFDRGGSRTNLIEAHAIVDEIAARLADPGTSERSIGVVTFNIQQRDLILTLLEDSTDLHIRRALDAPDSERLFVKNLENVQGDERDTILFSLAFSPDPETGKLPLNFGPLNLSGGERRLNVAVTRARDNVVLFSSFDPGHIDLTRTASVGVHDLRRYLEYAASGTSTQGATHQVRDRFSTELAAALTVRGLVVERGVGLSEFAVDLAVRRPDSTRWEMAIMLDSPAWNSRPTVVDRDGAPELLHDLMGWPRVHRAWLPGWLRDRDGMIDRIVAALDSPIDSTTQTIPDSATSSDGQGSPSTPAPPDPTASAPAATIDVQPMAANGPSSIPQVPSPNVPAVHDQPASEDQQQLRSAAHASGGLLGHQSEPAKAPGVFRPAATNALYPQSVLDSRATAFEYVTTIGETSLAVEGPMSLDRLTDVIVRVCGYSRIGQTKRAMIAEILRRSFVVTTEGGIFLWPRTVDPATWRAVRRTANAGDRTIQDVSVHEVAAAMSQIVTEAMSATREDLHRETLEMLNFVRLTDATRARLDLGLDYAVSTNRITERDGTYYPAG